MKRSRWSVGERLGAGFVLVLLVVAALVLVIARQLSENDRGSMALEAAVARTQKIDEMERALLLFAVSTRDTLLERSPESLGKFSASEARLNEAARAMESLDLGAEAGMATAATEIGALVGKYIGMSRSAVASGHASPGELVAAREAVLAHNQRMLKAQEGVMAETMSRMETNRRAAAATLAAGGTITCLLLIAIALLTMRSIRRPAKELVAVASALSAGDWQPALRLRDGTAGSGARFEMTQIAHAFGSAALALDMRERRLIAHAEIARAAGASLDRSQIADAALRTALAHVGAEVGVLYWLDAHTQQLVPIAARAAGAALEPVALGEGIVGQSARDARTVVVRDIPADTRFQIRLGVDDALPRTIAAEPILFEKSAIGVLLVASLRDMDADALSFLSSSATQIGVGLMNAQAHHEVQALLARTRAQAQEIQAQNEELQAQNEEIQAQTEELQAQSEELQAQSEELQAQSEELQAQSEELQAQNEDLQRQSADLQEQATALGEADARKNAFLGVLAHELRNPLTPIANSIELLGRDGVDPQVCGEAQEILARQVRHMTRLIDDLLDATRISHGKITLKRERLDLIGLVHECVADQRAALQQNGVALSLSLPDVPVYVDGDATRIGQVFSNLLVNAVKFCESGTRISMAVGIDGSAREVHVRVADNGIGIEAAFLARIFEPFTQADSELARTKGGLGLGLALAKALVELHGGRIQASSDGIGRGAEFVVTLPLSQAHEQTPEPAPPAQAKRSEERAGAMNRVLVIDDNTDAAESLGELLSFEGCDVQVAYSAQAGLEAALRFRPQAIVCDIGLPGMDGYEFAREARRNALLRSTVLVALTGYSSPVDRRRAPDAGFDVHMAKPPDIATLLASVSKRGAPAGAQPRSAEDGSA